MALLSNVRVECTPPDGCVGGWFSTTDLTGPFDDFRLTTDGRLLRAISVPQDEAPEDAPDDLPGLASFLARNRWEFAGEEEVDFDGFLRLRDGHRRLTARFSRGRLEEMRSGGLDAWVPVDGNPLDALHVLASAFGDGREQDPVEVRDFLLATLAAAVRG